MTWYVFLINLQAFFLTSYFDFFSDGPRDTTAFWFYYTSWQCEFSSLLIKFFGVDFFLHSNCISLNIGTCNPFPFSDFYSNNVFISGRQFYVRIVGLVPNNGDWSSASFPLSFVILNQCTIWCWTINKPNVFGFLLELCLTYFSNNNITSIDFI